VFHRPLDGAEECIAPPPTSLRIQPRPFDPSDFELQSGFGPCNLPDEDVHNYKRRTFAPRTLPLSEKYPPGQMPLTLTYLSGAMPGGANVSTRTYTTGLIHDPQRTGAPVLG